VGCGAKDPVSVTHKNIGLHRCSQDCTSQHVFSHFFFNFFFLHCFLHFLHSFLHLPFTFSQLCIWHFDWWSLRPLHSSSGGEGGGGKGGGGTGGGDTDGGEENLSTAPCLGVIRSDYNYPPSPGDIASPESYGYDVFYRVVPGLTFEVCKNITTKVVEGITVLEGIEEQVLTDFKEAIRYLDETKKVYGITGDCGFMLSLQEEARKHTKKPIFMSSLCQAPSVTNLFDRDELIAIFTSDAAALTRMLPLIKEQCRIDVGEERFIIVDCSKVDGFGIEIEKGLQVNVEEVSPLMVALAKKIVQEDHDRQADHKLRAIIFECTELPPYSDAVRDATGLPVFDSITASNAIVESMVDNPRFGKTGWQEAWDQSQEDYEFGQKLSKEEKERLLN